ncbi:MAG: alpha/beta fold hydrolase [Desulfovibrio sp.]|uniref:alpha/beta fold hydrolase n=1 Tax=Desulfovibrio sp. 7SRBS1 TaxID=3378064 RepID=UPI003B3EDAAE
MFILRNHATFRRHRAFPMLCALLALLALSACSARTIHYAPTPETVHIVHLKNQDIGYRLVGEKTDACPLLLVMGYAVTMDSWDPMLVQQLANGRQVILFDNRGTGYSTASPTASPTGSSKPFSLQELAQDAAALLDHLGMDQADVMGWSMGSMVAQEMALRHPEKVRKVVLYATDYTSDEVVRIISDPTTFGSAQEGPIHLFPKEWIKAHQDIVRAIPPGAHPVTPAMAERQLNAIAKWQGTASRLPGLQQPLLLFVGQNDTITAQNKSLDIASMVPGSWLVRIKGGGHGIMFQAPQDMARIVDTFLRVQQNVSPGNEQ